MSSGQVRILQAGVKAPSFTLADHSGNMVSLADFKGQRVLLYFYPEDDTPTCTAQACEFRDGWSEIRAAGAVVLGISPDTPAKHQLFRTRYGLPFPLLADEDRAVATAFGVWGEKEMYGRTVIGMIRTTFIIDATGVIEQVFPRVRTKGHAARVLAALK
ncbi:MAG: thioredoxin-dependent thiol peroxidase [Gemmatimonadota bacterium]